ncbi:MAG: thiamine pyrophosphate-binding protein, partial [Candidatus Bathyarchaeia archaeon]
MQDKAAIRSRKKNLREEIHCAITPSERTVDNKKMDNHSFEKISIEDLGQALVESIVYYGIKYWFVNVGSDWPPFMDAIAKRWAQKNEYPKFIICPHEFTATSMAHGYAMVSHDIPLVGYHTTVGTYNALGAIMNAYTARVPLFLLAGGGWITKEGLERIAEVPISQESRDQANPLREFIKWDCEIRLKEHIPKVVQRAIQISQTEPKGPVYISIPNDVALEKATEILLPPRELFVPPSPPQGKPTAIHSAAKLLVQAKYPLIVTREMGRNPAAVNRLIKLAELLAIPVSGALGKLGYMNFPTNHPLSASIPVEEADVVLVIEDHSPWKGECIPNPQAKYINLAVDPLYAHLYSITSHCPADIFITADPATA